MRRLTPRQVEALGWIRDFVADHGYAPTLAEMAEGLGVAKPTVQQYLQALEAKGAVARERYAHRSIEVLDEPKEGACTELPLLGRIAAGQPIEAVEVPDTVDVGQALGLGGDRELFCLEVKGDSTIEDGILDGDCVVVERRDTAEDGQTVVALLPDGTATLKRLYRERGRVRLQPANPAVEPIYAADVRVQGIVRGVLRQMT
ncbi:MAG: transcriptional repressor LexA [Planctomycetota bacterium]